MGVALCERASFGKERRHPEARLHEHATLLDLVVGRVALCVHDIAEREEFDHHVRVHPCKRCLGRQSHPARFGEPNFGELQRRIVERFVGSEATVDEIEEFVLADTPFRETHYKRQVLAKLEGSGEIEVVASPSNRRRNSFPPELRYRFGIQKSNGEL